MITRMLRLPRSLLIGLSTLLISLILAGSMTLVLFSRPLPTTLAATLQQVAGTTCAQAPSMEHCSYQDPEVQGCAANARTIGQATTILEHGFPIGRVERRWSARCQSWWGRVFDTRIGSQAGMYITIASKMFFGSPTFVSPRYRIFYSPMVFDATPTQPFPAIAGALEIDGITTPPEATLPAIILPRQRHTPRERIYENEKSNSLTFRRQPTPAFATTRCAFQRVLAVAEHTWRPSAHTPLARAHKTERGTTSCCPHHPTVALERETRSTPRRRIAPAWRHGA